jgi:CubicO group peptidase (beta-lactamase class C family)
MDWQAVAVEAGRIAQAWTADGGPGGAVLAFDGDDLRAQACGGLADLELGLPFRADTVVRFASISKHLMASLLLAEAGKPGIPALDDFLGSHLPLAPALGGVTIARALDMTGGLPDALEALWQLGVPPSAGMDHEALLGFVQRLDRLNFAPGSEIAYSNTGYRLVQAILAAHGIDYPARFAERLLRPLGGAMRFPYDTTEPVPHLAGGYWKSASGWRRGRYGLHISASGGWAGSAQDLASWLQALLAGRAPLEGVLPQLARRRTLSDGRPTAYGLGLARQELGAHLLVGHGGSLPGFRSYFLLDPETRAGVVVVCNREDAEPSALALKLFAALYGETLAEPARGVLPRGLFAMPGTPFWIEHQAGSLTWLGASDTLYPDGEGGVVNRSAHMPVRLRFEDGAIVGEISHVARRFVAVPGDLAAAPAWAGDWICPAQNARFSVVVAHGAARLITGAGPLRREIPLHPIGEGRALVQLDRDGPSSLRLCLAFSRDEVRLVSNRARGLRFSRG